MLYPFYPFFLYSFHQVQYMPDIPGAQTQLLKAAGKGIVDGDVGFQGTDRGELEELGQIREDGVEDHWHKEVAARVLLSTKPFPSTLRLNCKSCENSARGFCASRPTCHFAHQFHLYHSCVFDTVVESCHCRMEITNNAVNT